jgi:hypothetical protein
MFTCDRNKGEYPPMPFAGALECRQPIVMGGSRKYINYSPAVPSQNSE